MPFAYVMVSIEIGSEKQVVKDLETLPQIRETYMVYGIYDVIIKVEFADRNELREIIIRKIRGIHGIKSTITLLEI